MPEQPPPFTPTLNFCWWSKSGSPINLVNSATAVAVKLTGVFNIVSVDIVFILIHKFTTSIGNALCLKFRK